MKKVYIVLNTNNTKQMKQFATQEEAYEFTQEHNNKVWLMIEVELDEHNTPTNLRGCLY